MNKLESLIQQAPEIESRLGYQFKDKSLLALAFVHRSFINENRDVNEHNERLEFLGDSVLGILIAEFLYRKLPTTPEGDLSYLRSRLVEASSCMAFIQKLNLESYVLLGKGERLNDGRGRDSILADLFEAVIGAIYLDGGIESARQFIFRNFTPEIDAILMTPLQNWKAMLQDHCQKKFQQAPNYHVLSESGPDHSKLFKIMVKLNDDELGVGEGPSKKEAQQAAAADAVSRLNLKSQE
jgi:ribonuclease-3